MFRFRRQTEQDKVAPALVTDECEFFLTGRYLDHLLDVGDEVPSWVWINPVAHGSPDRLAEIAALGPGPSTLRSDYRAWRIVIAAIAEGVIAAAKETTLPIAEIQSFTLVPVEFALMANPVGPRTTLRVVEHALHRTAR